MVAQILPRSHRKYSLLPLKTLLKLAVPKQIEEAKNLHREYGEHDPELSIRYLMVATGHTIEDFEPDENSFFNQDEWKETLPDNWEEIIMNEIEKKPRVAISTIFRVLYPDQNIESNTALDILEFIAKTLKKWGWTRTSNPRIFNNPWMVQLSLNLFGDQ
jgi:hypothetical protein